MPTTPKGFINTRFSTTFAINAHMAALTGVRVSFRAKYPGAKGQVAVAAGVCAALRDGAQISATHRGHGHLVARGGDLNQMMAELMGKSTGYCNGKGGSMHI